VVFICRSDEFELDEEDDDDELDDVSLSITGGGRIKIMGVL